MHTALHIALLIGLIFLAAYTAFGAGVLLIGGSKRTDSKLRAIIDPALADQETIQEMADAVRR